MNYRFQIHGKTGSTLSSDTGSVSAEGTETMTPTEQSEPLNMTLMPNSLKNIQFKTGLICLTPTFSSTVSFHIFSNYFLICMCFKRKL